MNNEMNNSYGFRNLRYIYAKCVCDLLDRRDFLDENQLMELIDTDEKMKLLLLKTVERMPALQGEAILEDAEIINRGR